MSESEIFDRHARKMRRARALRHFREESPFLARTTADLIERLEEFSECFDQVLLWNAMALRLTDWLRDRGSTVTIADPGTSPHDEDMTPFPAA
ncbi:MAG: hypothetical protein KGJ05_03645, partial [Alphaproteobacteria bacterium]|nr:hypothetical protein [Alphaproteobacteria bacterium]